MHLSSSFVANYRRCVSYANRWGFAIYLAGKDGHEDSLLPSGHPVGTAEGVLDCVC
ncbi:hypothetical protein Aple_061420 [Acrocarpospora pleiomorpha]|uniref:Uncharacterized protein n=1 Tax=Acrocarpospora pleiomorpha TaxID=90975 RepID=A0A5M3XVA2_9ACTN|nr:hypothetical protein [Acrocarpospora pleiomorpha]GES23243.1 hypothetical protein Aple_061420 [Acrocarpospora pleiomorpha]